MNKFLRVGMVLVGSISLFVAIGFFLQMGWATQIWPFPSGRLSNIFVSSILAAIGAPVVWIGVTGERRALTGGAINLMVTNAGFAAYTLFQYGRDPRLNLLIFTIISTVMALLSIVLIFYGWQARFTDTRGVPALLKISFSVFAVVLFITSIALLYQRPNTFPWTLSGENSVLYGWIFLGAMCYFVYALIFPVSANVRGQLLGFLAYDIVLIVPFIGHFQNVAPEMLNSLIIYTTVVSYSGLLALYFLLFHPATRFVFSRK